MKSNAYNTPGCILRFCKMVSLGLHITKMQAFETDMVVYSECGGRGYEPTDKHPNIFSDDDWETFLY